ncbi:MAG TPA: hypothetical protein QF353_04585 [Gammaproteobacteria bacterium]|nr:hypothetical protein [Gammaproteobacteria bacterium]
MTVKHNSILMSLIILSGCAVNPNEQIVAKYSSNMEFKSYSCSEMIQENNRISHKLDELYVLLKKKGMYNDQYSQTWLGPTRTKQRKPEAVDFGKLKGLYEAINIEAKIKNCNMARFTAPKSFVV